jgi:hypothetical protein
MHYMVDVILFMYDYSVPSPKDDEYRLHDQVLYQIFALFVYLRIFLFLVVLV